MSEGSVRYETDGGVATVVFDRPEARNAMTWGMYEELSQIVEAIGADEDVRVAVFRGAGGKAFVAGTDIGQFTEFEGEEEGLRYERRIEALIGGLERVPVPTVAAVEGYAVGGGFAIAAVCDIRICTPDARFGLPIARTVGNCLSMENYARLVGLLGVSRTKKMLLTAELMSAEDALAAGFVAEVVPRESLEERVGELCERLIRNAPITMRVTKEAIRRIEAALRPEGEDLIREAYGSRDFKEGVSAFLEKRRPEWTGR